MTSFRKFEDVGSDHALQQKLQAVTGLNPSRPWVEPIPQTFIQDDTAQTINKRSEEKLSSSLGTIIVSMTSPPASANDSVIPTAPSLLYQPGVFEEW